MKYQLNIDLSKDTLDMIARANQKIVLVKHTAGKADSPVAWVTFKPWEYNTIEWQENFAVYASNTQVDNGATINKLADKQASTGACYPFRTGYFHEPVKDEYAQDNGYTIHNEDDELDGVTVGLAQDVVVNGKAYANNPINAVFLPRGQYATMTPIESVDIYLKNDIEDSTVVTHISSRPLNVVYNEGDSAHTISYNDSTGEFILIK